MSGQAKAELEQQFLLAVDLNEPEALIATLHRAAARKAEDAKRGLITAEEGQRWRNAANALMEAEAGVNAAQGPQAHELAEHIAEWTPTPHDRPPGAGEDAPPPAAIEGA